MAKTLGQALVDAAHKKFWTFKAPEPPEAPEGFVGNWESLSPGYRREIVRQLERAKKTDTP